MKKLFFLLFFEVAFIISSAQNNFNCISHEVFSDLIKNDFNFVKNQAQLEKETESFNQNKAKTNAATYVLPIVFHVIHTGGAGNISDAQIIDQVNILNKEFNRKQADTINTPSAFLPLAAPFSVEFRLPTIDPNGNCTNGINRIYSSLATCSYAWDAVKTISYWPSNKYINIWLVESMRYPGVTGCGGSGYSAFPGGPAYLDGIVMRSDLVGSIGSALTTTWGNWQGRLLIHELGHWFNLRHIWGDTNCGDDFVSDTPPHLNSNSGCPTFPRNPNSNCFGSNANGEMFTNYMDYSSCSCLNMFSAGQVARMTAAINSNISSRNNLWSNANLNATGTSNPYVYPNVCNAVPSILPYGNIVTCITDSVKIIDNSFGGQSTSRLWNTPGGYATSLTDSIIKIKYNSPGLYSISLTKNYLSASQTKTFSYKVMVLNDLPTSQYSFPIYESFEDSTLFKSTWTNLDKDNDGVKWHLTNATSFSGEYCLGINNFNKIAPLSDEVISPAFDLSLIDSVNLDFRLHFGSRIPENFDRLQIFISNNCGKKWTSIYSKTAVGAGTLKTVPGFFPSSYTPAVASNEWRLENVSINSALTLGNVNFKFVFTSGSGNNIFIDDINITGKITTGLKKQTNINPLFLFPNPVENTLSLKYPNTISKEFQIQIKDVTGRIWLIKQLEEKNTEEKNSQIDVSTLSKGVYFISIIDKQGIISNTKFIKQSSE